MTRTVTAVFAKLVVVVGFSLHQPYPIHAAGAIVSDTGFEIIPTIVTPSVYWVDDNRLLFAGIKTADMQKAITAKEENRVERLKKLYFWDDATKSVRLYADAQSACFSDGVIHYQVRVDKAAGKVVVKEGPFGSEKEIEKTLPSKDELTWQEENKRVRSNFTCRTHLRNELSPPAPQGRRIIVLREGDGYLDAGPQGTIELIGEIRANGPGNIRLFHPGRSAPIDLPITLEQGLGVPIYSRYLSAYVTLPRPKGSDPGHVTEWPRGLPFTVISFKATGETSEVIIPYDQLVNITWAQPTRMGWIFGGGNFYKSSGLYVFDGKKVSKIDVGLVREIAVAPDGCRTAVGIENKHLERGYSPVNLKVFDFCVVGR